MLVWAVSTSPATYDPAVETKSSLLGIFPEFNTADWVAGANVLANMNELIADDWGGHRDMVVALATADALARSPGGRAAKLVARNDTTTYGERLKDMKRAHACAYHRQG